MTSYVLKYENQKEIAAKNVTLLEKIKNYVNTHRTYLAVAMTGSNDARQMVDMLRALCAE